MYPSLYIFKTILASKENYTFLKYFCAIRINPLFNIRELPDNLCYVSPWYFNDIIFNVRRSVHIKNFPCIKSSDMYKFLLPKSIPTVQDKYNFKWEKIWPRTTFKYIKLHERDVLFKFLHGILPNKKRLYQMKQSNSPLCPHCNVIEDNSHMFLNCIKIQDILKYFKTVLNDTCNVEHVNIEKLLYLDIKLRTKKQMNTAIVLSVNYISTVWYNRCKNH